MYLNFTITSRYLLSTVLLFFFGFAISFDAISQEKAVERSGKTPKWINSTQKDFIIESGKGASIDEAKDRALINVKESIVKSVAEKITSSSEEKTQQVRQDNSYKISGNFQTVINSRTADLPFIKGISLNKVSDFYWEKLKDKKTGAIIYSYYLKYPFTDFELQSIILDYEMSQKRIEDELNEAIDGINEITTVEQILEKIQNLRGIVPQLDENEKRIASMNIVKLEGILKSISLEDIVNQKGTLKYFLVNGDRHFKTNLKPKVNSNCASNFRTSLVGDTVILRYDSPDCFEAVSNYISAEYFVGSYSIKNSFPLILSQNKAELLISGTLQLRSDEKDTLEVANYEVLIPIQSKFGDEIIIKSVSIKLAGHPDIIFKNLSNIILNNGMNEVSLKGQTSLKRSSYIFSDVSNLLVSGVVSYLLPKTGETSQFRFFNEHILFNW
jgi:hypothetical protein